MSKIINFVYREVLPYIIILILLLSALAGKIGIEVALLAILADCLIEKLVDTIKNK